jgi:hypothetical protein
MSYNPTIDAKSIYRDIIIMNPGDGRPETVLLSLNGVPYVWRRNVFGNYSLKMLADLIHVIP